MVDSLSEQAFTDRAVSSTLDPLMSAEGMVASVNGTTLGEAGGVTLSEWFVWVDWGETVLLHDESSLSGNPFPGQRVRSLEWPAVAVLSRGPVILSDQRAGIDPITAPVHVGDGVLLGGVAIHLNHA